jgi:hypothetical protein
MKVVSFQTAATPTALGGDSASTLTLVQAAHPCRYGAGIFEDSCPPRQTDETIAGNAYRPLAIKRRPAGAKHCVIDQVAPLFGPFLENVNRIFKAGDFLDDIFPVLDEHRWIEQTTAHRFLQEFQMSDIMKDGPAPADVGENIGTAFAAFKTPDRLDEGDGMNGG